MTANIPIFLVALALLWLPRSWLRRGRTLWRSRRRSGRHGSWANPPKDGTSLGFRREFSKARNYVDLARGWLGGLAILGGNGFDAAVRLASSAPPAMAHRVLAAQSAVLLLAVLIQTVRFERRRLSLSAPVFFIAGVSFATLTPFAGLCGFVIAWALNPVAPSAQAFLVVEAIIAAAAAYVLNGFTLLVPVGFALTFCPVLLSLLTRRSLVVFSPRSAGSNRT